MKRFIGVMMGLCRGVSSYSQVITDTSLTMIAFWEMEDEVVYEFKETVDKKSEGVKTLEETTYDLTMRILDSTETSYRIQWTFSNEQANYEESPMKKEFMEACGDVPIKYRTDELGDFETIENWEEIKEALFLGIETVLEKHKTAPDTLIDNMRNMLRSTLASEEQLNFWARDIRFFHYLYGVSLDLEKPLERVKLYSNPYIKKTMPGKEKISILAIDEENWIAKIKVESGIGAAASKALMYDFVINNLDNFGIKDKAEVKIEDFPTVSVKEEMTIIYNIDTGYILKGTYTKFTKMEEDYKRTRYEYQLKK